MKRTEVRQFADAALMDRTCASLGERGALAGIAPDAIVGVVQASALLELAAGEVLVREGDLAAPEVYLLVEGTLAVQSKGSLIARLEQPGAVIGEVAVVLGARRTADVVAETAVRALAVPMAVLKQPQFADIAAGIRGALLRDDWVKY